MTTPISYNIGSAPIPAGYPYPPLNLFPTAPPAGSSNNTTVDSTVLSFFANSPLPNPDAILNSLVNTNTSTFNNNFFTSRIGNQISQIGFAASSFNGGPLGLLGSLGGLTGLPGLGNVPFGLASSFMDFSPSAVMF